MTQLGGDETETTALMSHEALIAEIKRLRERLITLESENASMSIMLSQQQREVSMLILIAFFFFLSFFPNLHTLMEACFLFWPSNLTLDGE